MSQTNTNAPEQPKLGYRLDVDDTLGKAAVSLVESSVVNPISAEILHEQLRMAEVGDWHIDEAAIQEVLKKHARNIPTTIAIAERTDAVIQVQLMDDAMSAHLTYTPPYGGQAASVDDVVEHLIKRGVVIERINRPAIQRVLSQHPSGAQPVALGLYPKNGQNSRFVPLLDIEPENQAPVEAEDGTVDYLAGHVYLSVSAGTPLMRRIPPTPGQPGMDIYGSPLRAEPGKEFDFGRKTDGAQIAEDDPNLLIARVDGHPVFHDDCVHVDDSLILDNINLTSGHVEFDGSVLVKGDVFPDMRVVCSGDIFVRGVVERAYLKAGAGIYVTGGAIGSQHSDETRREYENNTLPEDDEHVSADDSQPVQHIPTLPEFECQLIAGTDIEVRYATLASLRAGHNIVIREYAFNAELQAGFAILAGQNGGKGNLVGGLAKAGHHIAARALGNKAYLHSYFHVGLSQPELQKIRHLRFIRSQRLEQARTLRRLLQELKVYGLQHQLTPAEIQKATKIHDTLLQIQKDLKELDKRLANITAPGQHEKGEPHISASVRCYPNCFITLNGAFLRTRDEHGKITLIKQGAHVTTQ